MAKSKKLVISGPMDAKHVGGINVMSSTGPGLDVYFNSITIAPDERPSHTYVAVGKTEIPRRSDTIANTIRRPSISLKRSLSRLRRTSTTHRPESRGYQGKEHQEEHSINRSESADTHRSLKMQPSVPRLRQRVGLDRETQQAAPTSTTTTPEPEVIPEPIQKDYPPLQQRKALACPNATSSIYTTLREPETPRMSFMPQRQPSTIERKQYTIQHRPSLPQHQPSFVVSQKPQPPARTTRADSGTAIDFTNVPVQERPIPFKEIMAVPSLAERMAMYKKTREYWATADHGLLEWTGRAVGPRNAVTES